MRNFTTALLKMQKYEQERMPLLERLIDGRGMALKIRVLRRQISNICMATVFISGCFAEGRKATPQPENEGIVSPGESQSPSPLEISASPEVTTPKPTLPTPEVLEQSHTSPTPDVHETPPLTPAPTPTTEDNPTITPEQSSHAAPPNTQAPEYSPTPTVEVRILPDEPVPLTPLPTLEIPELPHWPNPNELCTRVNGEMIEQCMPDRVNEYPGLIDLGICERIANGERLKPVTLSILNSETGNPAGPTQVMVFSENNGNYGDWPFVPEVESDIIMDNNGDVIQKAQTGAMRADGETLCLFIPETYLVETRSGYNLKDDRNNHRIETLLDKIRISLEPWNRLEDSFIRFDAHIHPNACGFPGSVTPYDAIRHAIGSGSTSNALLYWNPNWENMEQMSRKDIAELEAFFKDKMRSLTKIGVENSGFRGSRSGHITILGSRTGDVPRVYDEAGLPFPHLLHEDMIARIRMHDPNSVVIVPHLVANLPNPAVDLRIREFPRIDFPSDSEMTLFLNPPLRNALRDPGAFDAVELANGNWVIEHFLINSLLRAGFDLSFVGATDSPCNASPGKGHTAIDHSRLNGEPGIESCILPAIRRSQQGIEQGCRISHISNGAASLESESFNDVEPGYGDDSIVYITSTPGVRPNITFRGRVSAYLPEYNPSLPRTEDASPEERRNIEQTWQNQNLESASFWDRELARVPGTRDVLFKIDVNGLVVHETAIHADGSPQDLEIEFPIDRPGIVQVYIENMLRLAQPVRVHLNDQPPQSSPCAVEWVRDTTASMKDMLSELAHDGMERYAIDTKIKELVSEYDKRLDQLEPCEEE